MYTLNLADYSVFYVQTPSLLHLVLNVECLLWNAINGGHGVCYHAIKYLYESSQYEAFDHNFEKSTMSFFLLI